MTLSSAIDRALDLAIAPGYGNVGLALRRRLPDWPQEPGRMDGRTVLITGAASGIGLAAGIGFARLGARVLALGRDEQRGNDARGQILEAVPDAEVIAFGADVSSLAEVRELCTELNGRESAVHVLVNNAGVMPDERQRSADGHELMFATHVLGPCALVALLRDLLQRSAPARVINVSSGGLYGQSLPTDDPESEQVNYSPKKFYARTKREQLALTEEWAQRLNGTGVVVHAMHPGWADTEGVRQWLPVFRVITRPIIRTPEQAADTIVWLGAAQEPLESSGCFWHDRRPRPVSHPLGPAHASRAEREQLWSYCVSALAQAGIELSA